MKHKGVLSFEGSATLTHVGIVTSWLLVPTGCSVFCGSVLTHQLQFDGQIQHEFIFFFNHLLFLFVFLLKSFVERHDGDFNLEVKGTARHLHAGNFSQKSSHFCKRVGGMD